MVPTTSHVGLDAETALAILPSAAEFGVDRLEFEEFMSHDREFGDLPAFRVRHPYQSKSASLVVFANADDAHLSMDRGFIIHKSQGYPPIWLDLGDESFFVRYEVVVRVGRYILRAMPIRPDCDWLRPSLQRLQTLVPSPRPTVSAFLCYLEVWDWFERALERLPGLPEKIGCPIEEHHHVETAVSQDFQGGYMIWLGGWEFIYVLYDEGGWESYSDRWQEGMPEFDSSFGPPPAGVIQPKRGFGLVWQEHPEVREGLGWAFNEERACDEAHLQEFHGGEMLECTQFVMPRQKTRIFILFDDGTYTIYMP